MTLHRRQFLQLAAGAAAVPAFSQSAWAQAYPARPVQLIVSFPAGSAPDIIARLAGQHLFGAPRSAVRDREQAGRRRQYRHRIRRESRARRLYDPGAGLDQRGERGALPQSQFRFHPRYRGQRHVAFGTGQLQSILNVAANRKLREGKRWLTCLFRGCR
jgi:hypothetical protein